MFKQFALKAKLSNAFKMADVSHTIQHKSSVRKRYPAILDIRENEDFLQYVFMIPPGMNPKDLTKKEYIFTQIFGSNFELTGDGLKYSLKIHKKELEKKFGYNYEGLKPFLGKGIPIIAGQDIHGKFHVYNMVTNPHLLVAGETGSGKSVMLRSILTTLILHFESGIDLYLADMKRSEFHLFRHCRNVKAVMTKKAELKRCLNYISQEMKDRGDLLDAHEVSHIDEYNKIKGVEKKNYILLCIDEVALLKKDIDLMNIVEEISCIGRALGVFLILSMQRPDSKVLEGQLKNNLTVRYAFRHSDKINSDITLGRGTKEDAGKISMAEKGKFYFKNESIILLQAPYLELEPAKDLLEPYKIKPYIEMDAETIEENQDFEPLPVLKGEDDEPA